ncbi:hypothetical protein [Hymenobacter glaciei]
MHNTQDPHWRDYLFQGHPPAELSTWVQRLRYFRFCKAYGAHSNDGDQLLAALRYVDAADLRRLLAQLGTWAPLSAQLIALPSGLLTVAGQQVSAWHYDLPEPRLMLAIRDLNNPYEVTAATIAAAEAVEQQLALQESRIIDPPQDNRYCVCPQYYPELWEKR